MKKANSAPMLNWIEEDSYDISEETSDASFLEQFTCTQQE